MCPAAPGSDPQNCKLWVPAILWFSQTPLVLKSPVPASFDSAHFAPVDGYTVDDILLYWEGSGNAVQGTEKLHIPQFSFLGKTISTKEVFFYTGGSDPLLLSCLLSFCMLGHSW